MPTVSIVVGTDVGFSTVGDCEGVEVGAWLKVVSVERVSNVALWLAPEFSRIGASLLSSFKDN